MNSINFGDNNRGGQVGINNGQIYFPAERPETPPAPLSTFPFRHDPDFVNRGTLLDQIDEKGSFPGARVALVGLGGVGKSQLAIEYSYRVQDRSPDTWVFWIHTANATRFEQSCREIADRLHDTRRKWMLILDNLDDNHFLCEHNFLENDLRPIWAYFSSLGGLILITSRSRRVASSIVEDDDIVAVEAMDENHAILLFKKKLEPQANIEDCIQLAAALDFIPLTIVQPQPISSKECHAIPNYLIQQDQNLKGLVNRSFEDDMLMLKDYSLISISAEGVSFEIHRLVQIAMPEWLKTHEQLEIWKECFIKKLHSRFPDGIFEN
ncbi:Tetratricopeptide-like helical [Penicillium malachiteum]|uniref:Tetratricopeptide-like helical n=1 Tax=Penicillium malachiteum TaxID=1324776 RepID=UPI002546BE5A|nr:Tetratricopeptide-like helical [Penicillium malachiteum]KAJ5720444.1 Tetratricopeptide-like helical [Penicillium malachiteum]